MYVKWRSRDRSSSNDIELKATFTPATSTQVDVSNCFLKCANMPLANCGLVMYSVDVDKIIQRATNSLYAKDIFICTVSHTSNQWAKLLNYTRLHTMTTDDVMTSRTCQCRRGHDSSNYRSQIVFDGCCLGDSAERPPCWLTSPQTLPLPLLHSQSS